MTKYVLALLASLALAGTSFAAEPMAELSVIYTAATDVLPAFVAKERGIFEEKGLKVTLTRTTVTPTIIPVLVSKTAQIGMSTPPHLLQGTDSGLDLVIVSGGSRIVASAPTISLLGRSGADPISKPEDLKGKRIGVPGLMGMVDVALREWLSQKGVPLNSVTFIETPIPQMGDILKSGRVDAVAAVEPIRTRVIGGGIGYLVSEFYAELNPDSLGVIWVATREWASNNKELAQRFRASLDQAIALIAKEPEMARTIEHKYLGLNAPKLSHFQTTVTAGDLAFFEKLLRKANLLHKPIDLATFIHVP